MAGARTAERIPGGVGLAENRPTHVTGFEACLLLVLRAVCDYVPGALDRAGGKRLPANRGHLCSGLRVPVLTGHGSLGSRWEPLAAAWPLAALTGRAETWYNPCQ